MTEQNRIIVVDIDGVILPGMPEQWGQEFERAYPEFGPCDRTRYSLGITDPEAKKALYKTLHSLCYDFYEVSPQKRFNWTLVAELQRSQAIYGTRVNFVTHAPSADGFAVEARAKLEMLQRVLPEGFHWSYSASHDSKKLHFPGALMIEDNQACLESWCAYWDAPGILWAQPWNAESNDWTITRVSDAYQLRLAFEAALGVAWSKE